ncbi:MAG: apolipoprotein N-acyltransferase [Microcoleaceae cyanobacterium]
MCKYYWIITFISGILMGLGAEPWGVWILPWFAFVPLWFIVIQQKEKQSLLITSAIAWAVGYYGLTIFWITGIHPMTWMGVPWLASLATALFCWIFITAWGTGLTITWVWIFSLICGFLNYKHQSKNISKLGLILSRVLVGTALWCGLELLWSHTPLWWSSFAYTQSYGNLAILHLGQISGPNTITAAIVIINGVIAEGINQSLVNYSKKRYQFFIVPIILFTIFHGIGFSLYRQPLNDLPENVVKVGIIQGNIPNKIKLNSIGWQQAIYGYTKGYKALASQGVDVVITPETALPFLWTEQTRRNSSFYQAILQEKVLAFLGGFSQVGNRLTNSLLAINSEGQTISQYDKVNLVPLGEYIPFESILGQWIDRLSPLDAHLIKGKPNQQFKTPFGKVIVGICYDSAFSRHFQQQAKNGGEWIVTASNDAHYTSAMLAQHHAQDVMRAIEMNRWTVRATNTGYSAIVNPKGETIWISKQDTYATHTDLIYRRTTQTLYVRWGDWLTPMLIILSSIIVSFYLWKNRGNTNSFNS